MRRPVRPSRLFRAPRRVLALSAAAIALLFVAFLSLERAPARSAASRGQELLDTRLVWARASDVDCWPAVAGPRNVYLWERRDDQGDCAEIDSANGRGQLWTALGMGGDYTELSCPPLLEEGRIYVVDTAGQLAAYDLDGPFLRTRQPLKPPVSPLRSYTWASGCPGFVICGLTQDGGTLYAGVACGPCGPGVVALDASSGKFLWWAPAAASVVGAPAVGERPGVGKVVVAAGECAGSGGLVLALDAAGGRPLWSFNLPFHPTASPVVASNPAGGIAVVGGVGGEDRPGAAGVDLLTGTLTWMFRSPHPEPGADEAWSPYAWPANGGHAGPRALAACRRQPGGVAVAADGEAAGGPAGGSAYFACGRRVYALDLADGRLRWEQAPEVDSAAIRAVNAAVDTPRPRGRITKEQMLPSELPRAPWVTAPVLLGREVLVGTPDGVRAMDAGDGKPTWRLGRDEVGAVDAPPSVRNGVAHVTGRRCFDSDVPRARQRVVYAVRLDGPAAAAVLTAPPWPQQHWPRLVAVLVGLTVAAAWAGAEKKDKRAVADAGHGGVGGAGSGPGGSDVIGGEATNSPPRKRLRWPDALPVLCVLAAAAVLVGWAARHPVPLPSPVRPGSITGPSSTYGGSMPAAMLGGVLGLTALAVPLGVWRRQKLATAAMLSLAIGAAVAALWWRGRKADESVTFFTWQLRADRVLRRTFRLVGGRGGFRLATTRKDYTEAMGVLNARDPQRFLWSREPGPPHYPALGPISPPFEQGTVRRWHGFEARRCVTTDPASGDVSLTSTSLTAPAWSLLAATTLLPSAWLVRAGWRWRKRRRVKPGRCLACGYDLTGNVSGVCPECGTALGVKQRIHQRH